MSRADKLLNDLGNNMAESVGARAPVDPVHQDPESHGGPYDGFRRLEGAGLVPLDNVIPDPNNPRTEWDEEDLARLAESIRRRGVLQPIRTRWDAELGKHVITVGERRYRGAVRAGLTHIPCLCTTTAPTASDILLESLQENLLRSDLSALDEANAYRKFMTLSDCTAKDLAAALHVSQSKVSRALALLDLPSEVQEQVATGEISPTAGAEIAKIRNPVVQRKVASKAAASRAPAAEVAKTVRQRQGAPVKATGAKPLAFKVARGVVVTVRGRLDGRGVVEALRAATRMAEAALDEPADEQAEEQGE
jgi:ParB family chromosome partitioning protein